MEHVIRYKSEDALRKKALLNLLVNALIAVLGISSLYIKFFLVDGVLAFRAFTVDGNLFTTVTALICLTVNVRELKEHREIRGRGLYFLKLCSAVSEAVIFIIVMIGYLPFVSDKPAITPYHMFCLHVAIPVITVAGFILAEKPVGFIKPHRLLISALPATIYGTGVITAIKRGLLPMSLVPYSFLDLDSHFFWYILLAGELILSFCFFWAWLFYRLNLRAARFWYDASDLDKLTRERYARRADFDVINSGLLMGFSMCGAIVLMLALIMSSKTVKSMTEGTIENMAWMQYSALEEKLGEGDWHFEDGVLYKGGTRIGDGSAENALYSLFNSSYVLFDSVIYAPASELAAPSSPDGCVAVTGWTYENSSGEDVLLLSEKALYGVLEEEYMHEYYGYETIGGTKYLAYYRALTEPAEGELPVVACARIEAELVTIMAKQSQNKLDLHLIALLLLSFSLMILVASRWVSALEKTVEYLRRVASEDTPEKPLTLGFRGRRLKGLVKHVNSLADKARTEAPENNPEE